MSKLKQKAGKESAEIGNPACLAPGELGICFLDLFTLQNQTKQEIWGSLGNG